MKKIVIFGAGGFAREVQQLISDINKEKEIWELLGFIVDSNYVNNEIINGLHILGDERWFITHPEVSVVIAIGDSELRKNKVLALEKIGKIKYPKLIHPRAWVGDFIEIGEGTIICAGALITTNVKIGKHVHVNIGSTIGHDAELENFVTLNPSVNISGNVVLQECSEIGTGTVIIPKVKVGRSTTVGAGSIVIRDLDANGVAVGAPAKIIKEK